MARGELILVVDDDPDLCAVIVELLESHGLEVMVADSVARALQLLDERTPALVLLDWFLPDGPPLEIIPRCRARGVPVVVSSASSDTAHSAKALGATAVLPKPFDVDRFYRIIDETLGHGAPAHS